MNEWTDYPGGSLCGGVLEGVRVSVLRQGASLRGPWSLTGLVLCSSVEQDFPGRPEPQRGAAHDREAGLQEQRCDQHQALQPRLPHPRHLLPPEQEACAGPLGQG